MNDLVTANGNIAGPVCVLLVGLPGSGKSTWRTSLGTNYTFLSTDDYVEKVAKAYGTTYDRVWVQHIDEATKAMDIEFREAIESKKSIAVDRTNLSLKSRRKFLSQLPKIYSKVAVYFEIDEELRQMRMKGREGKLIPAAADDRLRSAYVRPTKDEGFDMILTGVA